MTGTIDIRNRSPRCTEIDIEGIIGIPEDQQFTRAEERTATYGTFRERLESIRSLGTPEIVVNIRSTGGSVQDALLIHDALLGAGRTITTRCYGYVASAATVIAQAASNGKREMSANALYLIHRSTSAAEGDAESLGRTARLLGKTDERLAELYARRAGKDADTFIDLMGCEGGNGSWLSAEEALAAGLIDRIVAPESEYRSSGNRAGHPDSLTNSSTMTIKQQWTAVLGLLGLSPGKAAELTESGLETLNDQIAGQALQSEELCNRIADLEADNARLRAEATRTEPREDPPYDGEPASPNLAAYREDARNFR